MVTSIAPWGILVLACVKSVDGWMEKRSRTTRGIFHQWNEMSLGWNNPSGHRYTQAVMVSVGIVLYYCSLFLKRHHGWHPHLSFQSDSVYCRQRLGRDKGLGIKDATNCHILSPVLPYYCCYYLALSCFDGPTVQNTKEIQFAIICTNNRLKIINCQNCFRQYLLLLTVISQNIPIDAQC